MQWKSENSRDRLVCQSKINKRAMMALERSLGKHCTMTIILTKLQRSLVNYEALDYAFFYYLVTNFLIPQNSNSLGVII